MYSVSFTVTKNKCCLSLHYNGGIAVYLLMVKKFTNSKQEIPKLWQQLCLGNISKDWSANNMKKKKKKGFNGYVYYFSVDYDATDIDDILDIHKSLMKKK